MDEIGSGGAEILLLCPSFFITADGDKKISTIMMHNAILFAFVSGISFFAL